jgi:hypothetical protein
MSSALTPLKAIQSLEQIASERKYQIAGEKSRFAHIDDDAKRQKDQVRIDHREANRRLIDAIRHAQTLGIHVEDAAKIVKMSAQAIYRLEAELKKWDSQHPKETK